MIRNMLEFCIMVTEGRLAEKQKNSRRIVQNIKGQIKKEAICRNTLSWGDSTNLYCFRRCHLKLYCIFAAVGVVW